MNFGKLNRLNSALERVRRHHPDRFEDFSNPEALSQTDIGKRIKRQVLEWKDAPHFVPLIESMGSIERQILPTYIRDSDRTLAIRIAQCVASKPDLGDREVLLTFLHRNSDREIIPYLLTALGKDPQHYGLSNEMTSFIRDWKYDDLDAAIKNAWRRTKESEPQAVAGSIGFDPDSNLGKSIREGFLSHAPATKWVQVGPKGFLNAFESAHESLKLRTLVRLWTGWRMDPIKSLKLQPFPRGVGEFLVENRRIVDLLVRHNREAHEFYNEWLKSLELNTFFDAFPDSERFAFWESYLPRLTGVRGDREYGRLFLDFGNFGVIEFAEAGNAAYVYPPEHFEFFLELNFRRRDSDPGVVKSIEKAMFRLTHTKNWRSNFRAKLRDYV